MKNYIRTTVITAVIFLAGILLFAVMTSGSITQDSSRETISALNDIARTAEENRTELDVLDGCGYSNGFVILDMTDNVLYSNTSAEERLTVETAIQKRYPYQYLRDESGVWGCVIIPDDGLDGYRSLRYKFISGMAVCAVLILFGMFGFGVYLDRKVITPFKKMQSGRGQA